MADASGVWLAWRGGGNGHGGGKGGTVGLRRPLASLAGLERQTSLVGGSRCRPFIFEASNAHPQKRGVPLLDATGIVSRVLVPKPGPGW